MIVVDGDCIHCNVEQHPPWACTYSKSTFCKLKLELKLESVRTHADLACMA